MRTRALLATAPGEIELGEVTIPEPGPGEVLIETSWTCVSPGTELRLLSGVFPDAGAWPFVPGYTLSGRVVARGPGVSLAEGTRVFAGNSAPSDVANYWGGHAAHGVCRAEELVVLPDGLDLVLAPLAKLAAIAHRGSRFSQPRQGLRVAVIGLGPIGQLSARIHAALGAETIGADLRADRVQLLSEAGVRAICPEGELAAAFHAVWPEGADVIVDATGSPRVMAAAVEIAREKPWDNDVTAAGPLYVVQGSYPAHIPLPYDPIFMREMTLCFPRDMQRADYDAVLALMVDGRLQARSVISKVLPVEQAPGAYAALREPDSSLLTVAFDWQG